MPKFREWRNRFNFEGVLWDIIICGGMALIVIGWAVMFWRRLR
jgi:hypothetical protein